MVITALIMGFAGSLHCVGMCSPLVMAVSNIRSAAMMNRLIYNSGRILTYGILGALVGTAGWSIPFLHMQNVLSIILGIALLIFSIMGIRNIKVPFLMPFLQKASLTLKTIFGKYLRKKTRLSVFILGSLNGILPCGLTFLALAVCLTLDGPVSSFNFMLVFGIGTLPVMLGLTSVLNQLVKKFDINIRKVTTTMLFISGCLLIARVFLFHQHNITADHGLVDIILCR
ncbi:MAG: hypothetical protein C0490_18215 [Marivirga sp.]|nr:hypothetical protein [Marivirga sp.]